MVGVKWIFRAIFFVVILVTTIILGFVVLIDQGLYAALLMISLPIGALGFIKARYCPLVARERNADAAAHSTSDCRD